jgi:hypothetical protein
MLFPPNELVHVVELTANIWMATRSRLETRLRPLSMTWPQFGVLLALGESDGVTQRALMELLDHFPWTLGQTVPYLRLNGVTPPEYSPF